MDSRLLAKKKIISLVAVLALVITACSTQQVTEQAPEQEPQQVEQEPQQTTEPPSVPTTENVKTFVITGENFKFLMDGIAAPELHVQQGDRVRIEFTSAQGLHDWTLDEFNAATEKVQSGASTAVEFVADKKGTFEYYCSIGSHRRQGMRGNLIVE